MLIMQYKKKTHPPSSIKEIIAMHTSTNLKGFKNGASCLLFSFKSILYLSFSIRHLLQQVANHNIIDTATEAAEKGNMKH